MIHDEEVFQIGYVQRLHGVAGEVAIRFTDDVFDRADADYVFLKLDGLLVPFFIESYRFKSDEVVLMKFLDVNGEPQAQQICGAGVFFPLSLVPDTRETVLTWNYLTGFQVEDVAAGPVGEVVSVDSSSANILLSVRRSDGCEIQIPFHEDLLESCDEKTRTLRLRLPEGLLSLND